MFNIVNIYCHYLFYGSGNYNNINLFKYIDNWNLINIKWE